MCRIAIIIALLPGCGALCSCGLLAGIGRSKPESTGAELVINKSDSPFANTTATLRYPGAPAAPATATSAGTTGAASPMFDFSTAFSGGTMRSRAVNWRRSGSEAAVESRRSGLPVLIFFSNHATPTAALLETMFNTAPEAADIARSFIPLYIDFADKDTRDSPYYRAMLDRYKPRGYPALVVTLPDGAEVVRQSGYAGESKTESEWRKRTLQFITAAAVQSEKTAAARRKKLETQGWRTWTNSEGKPVFARLEKLDANQAMFTGEWGESFLTFINRLSEADRQAIKKHHAVHREIPQQH